MSKFNETETVEMVPNYMGEGSFALDPKMELISILFTSFVQDSYYESENGTTTRIKELMSQIKDKKFIAKASIYARNKMRMRSVTHLVSGELAQMVKGEEWTKSYYNKVVERPDDITEILAYYISKYGDSIPNSLKKGLAEAFGKFDEYALAKYRGEKKKVSLVDAVRLVHPHSSQKNEDALDKLVKGKLKSFDTWETKLTQAGTSENKEEAKSEAWKELIDSGKIGYFALIRNLRNILEQCPDSIDKVIELITDKKRVLNSKLLPFRFLTAYEALNELKSSLGSPKVKFEKDNSNVDKIIDALNIAISYSINNIPLLEGKTYILSDNSGSMTGDRGGSSRTSRFSNTKTSDIANLFAVLYWMRADNTLVGLFGDRLIKPSLNRKSGVFDNFDIIDNAKNSVGGGTETGIFVALEELIKTKTIVDTIVVFSDCQIGDGCSWYDNTGSKHGDSFNELFKEYCKINPKVKAFSVDLKGYGTTVFNGNVCKVYGWSDQIFDIMEKLSLDKRALIKEIEAIEL